ncbi:glycosyltransferase family 2 protein [Butyrivibrio sp. VCD2006]|uniref:glycosyltransferase family 2 protein n=1 Tax=Butyrivibrio sp. VCD2006 TaxID=1280664 RepID=UPI0003FAF2C3|nr:glycosyltransferase family A protein [Butyrivibrio sp. VCD2006]
MKRNTMKLSNIDHKSDENMLGNSLISVIVPVYNGEMHVKKCIKMLEEQTYKNIEVLMINDGSADKTLEKFFECKPDNRFNIYSKKNAGVSSARNCGISLAKGEYILFIDVDDYVYPWHIEQLYSNITKYNADVSVCGYYKLRLGEEKPVFHQDSNVEIYSGEEAAIAMLYRKKLNGYPVVKLIKADMVKSIHFWEDVPYSEDMIFVYELFLMCKRIAYTPSISYLYYQVPNSAVHTMQYSKIQPSWNAIKRLFGDIRSSTNGRLSRAIINKQFTLACNYASNLQNEKSSILLKKELCKFVERNAKTVLVDNNTNMIWRFIACCACINPYFAIKVCEILRYIKNMLRIETRRSL